MITSALRAAAASFREANAHLHESLRRDPVPSHLTRSQAGQLGADALAVAEMIAELHDPVVALWHERESEGQQLIVFTPLGGALADDPLGRFIVLTKALLIFLRAYQDAMYAMIFEIVERRPTGNRRMQEASKKPENPVGRVLRTELSGYLDWFDMWRKLRNEVKDGINFSLLGPTDDLAITFTRTTNAGEYVVFDIDAPVVRISHLAQAFEVSAALARMTDSLSTAHRATSP